MALRDRTVTICHARRTRSSTTPGPSPIDQLLWLAGPGRSRSSGAPKSAAASVGWWPCRVWLHRSGGFIECGEEFVQPVRRWRSPERCPWRSAGRGARHSPDRPRAIPELCGSARGPAVARRCGVRRTLAIWSCADQGSVCWTDSIVERSLGAGDLQAGPGYAGLAVVQVDRERGTAIELTDDVEVVRSGDHDRLTGLGDCVPRVLKRRPTGRGGDRCCHVLEQIERVPTQDFDQPRAGRPGHRCTPSRRARLPSSPWRVS